MFHVYVEHVSENEIKNRWNSVGIKKRASSDALDEVKSGNKNEFNVFNKQSRHSSYSGDSDGTTSVMELLLYVGY